MASHINRNLGAFELKPRTVQQIVAMATERRSAGNDWMRLFPAEFDIIREQVGRLLSTLPVSDPRRVLCDTAMASSNPLASHRVKCSDVIAVLSFEKPPRAERSEPEPEPEQ